MKIFLILGCLISTQVLFAQNYTEFIQDTPLEGIDFGSIAFGDINDDGHSDLLMAGQGWSTGQFTKLYLNDGVGNFSEMISNPFAQVSFS